MCSVHQVKLYPQFHSEQSMWAEREWQEKVLNARGISGTHALRSVPAPQPPAHAPSFSVTSAHRSVPARPIFGPLRFPLHFFSIAIMSYLFPEIGLYFYFYYCNL